MQQHTGARQSARENRAIYEILSFEPHSVPQHLPGRRLPCDLRDLQFARWITRQRPGFYGTGHGFTFQISAAYSAIVRSVENFPELATFKMAFRAQASWSPYKSSKRWSASRYDFKSARCR